MVNNITLENVAIESGNIFAAVMRKGSLARIIIKIRALDFLGSNLYHSRSHITRYIALHLTEINTYNKLYYYFILY